MRGQGGGAVAVKTKTLRWLILSVGLISVICLVLLGYHYSSRTAEPIPPGALLEQARELSKGRKGVCLDTNQQAASAVGADDGYLEWNGEKISKFEMAAGFAIADIPAGTDYDVIVNSYDDGVARGSMVYQGDYGSYNYEMKKSSAKGEWSLVSTVACKS